MAVRSWVAAANEAQSDFPLENLPYGVFRQREKQNIGVAIGDRILNLCDCARAGLLDGLAPEIAEACNAEWLNPLMGLGPEAWTALRRKLTALLNAEADAETQRRVEALLIPMNEAEMQVPAQIGDYTDFYASIHHATRVGALLRPDNPLLPNYKHLPIGYHGRASSIVASGTEIKRPHGQTKSAAGAPEFGPAGKLDYELEVGFFVGQGNQLGVPIPIVKAERHIFGACLVNDWSARDIQTWEYQPLGPFLGKSFATTISAWVVPMEALEPYRVKAQERPAGDPEPLEYLREPKGKRGAIDVMLEVYLESRLMRQMGLSAVRLSQGNLRELYWTPAQLLAHHTSNGCNLRPGDLLATGTVSGREEGSEGCLLEKRHNPEPIRLPSGETRTFLEDGDRVKMRGYRRKVGLPRIGFGECVGMVVSAAQQTRDGE
ncbi:MAG TPA: fumarylacetoacetase [Terracidiphilus sp.]|nr:fumarylacetoacetase [Terracidiphilus sp.]